MGIGNVGGTGRLGITRGTGVAWWALAAHVVDGISPGLFADVLKDRYALGGASCSLTDLLTVTNASTIRTYINQSGVMQTAAANTPRIDWSSGVRELLLEGAATNLLINSAAPSTQIVATTATTYTLSFYGTGTVTRSGTSTGATTGTSATTRTSITFAATAGTLTLTISGSVTNAQVEANGAPTSYIPTTSTAVTRTADLCQLSAAAAAVLQGAGAAVALRGTISSTIAAQVIIGATGGSMMRGGGGTPSALICGATSGVELVFVASGAIPGPIAACMGFGPAGLIGSNYGSPPATNTSPSDKSRSVISIGPVGGLSAGQILRLRQLVGWSLPSRPSAAAVQAQARVAS